MTDTGGCGNIGISIHALREEGDYGRSPVFWVSRTFLSTPSARRATRYLRWHSDEAQNFYPRPPRGGRRQLAALILPQQTDFYPRPPRGGRHADRDIAKEMLKFLSTPSARRATPVSHKRVEGCQVFLSTPSARRATVLFFSAGNPGIISIHALREEGDERLRVRFGGSCKFLSTPSARRATGLTGYVEGKRINFYPRPPRGGRQRTTVDSSRPSKFLSTPSARRATQHFVVLQAGSYISIHALREEGDTADFHNL